MIDMKNVGAICAAARRKSGMTQKNVADYLGYSIQNISHFENGRIDNSFILLYYMGKFGIDIKEVLHHG